MRTRTSPVHPEEWRQHSSTMNPPFWIPLIVAACALVPFSLCISTGDKVGCGCMVIIISLMLVTAIRLR